MKNVENSIYAPPKAEELLNSEGGNGLADNELLVVVYTPKGIAVVWLCLLFFSITIQPKVSFYFLAPACIFWLGIFVLAFFQRKVRLGFYLSRDLAKKYRRNRLISIVFTLLVVPTFVLGMVLNIFWLPIVGGVFALIAILNSFFTNKIVKLVRYKKKAFWVKGAHLDFLAHLPSVQQSSIVDGQVS